MTYTVYVEKEQKFSNEAINLFDEIVNFLEIKSLKHLRIINKYEIENIDDSLFDDVKTKILSEPQVDKIYTNIIDINIGDGIVIAVENLPGQFNQRADSAEQCIRILSGKTIPKVRTAKIYVIYSDNLKKEDIMRIKRYIINPVECREADFENLSSINIGSINEDSDVSVIDGFINFSESELKDFIEKNGLAMDIADIKECKKYFLSEGRNPTFTEIKVIDTYWSDHCRHTTFSTIIDNVNFSHPLLEKTYKEYIEVRNQMGVSAPISLMDIGTIFCRYLRYKGELNSLDVSDEVNACTVKVDINVNGEKQPWLLLFKNETHNHPTEIEPFGGAATCIGGAIRDPLSGRAYVYSAMRLTGSANPLRSISDTISGKLPQKKIITCAAKGYSSYGNQIGIATGIVDEIYHEGYMAKHMEIGAVLAAVPANDVKRCKPIAGDVVILVGGKTGRDGCGGATGSSKIHTSKSLEMCGSEVQKGNAPEERKIQRLFRKSDVRRMIKRCNDFGAGGIAVSVGEIAEGLEISLDAVPKKYDGLDGTELAISESQERMAVVVSNKDLSKFLLLAHEENVEATVIARVTSDNYIKMIWNKKEIVNISRKFLNTNGARKHISVTMQNPLPYNKSIKGNFTSLYKSLANDLNVCSKKGLSEQFDSTIGAGTILMPFGGKYQTTPIQAMVHKISLEKGHTNDCSLMSWGYNPYIFEKSPYHGAYLAVVESISKLIATGVEFKDIYLTFQEYFERLNQDNVKWGKPFSALLGAFKAQKDLNIASIGGKDSMSGSFEDLNVPPTLVSFAVTTEKIQNIISNEFKYAKNNVIILKPGYDNNNLPVASSLIEVYGVVNDLVKKGIAISVYTPTYGAVAEAVMKMCFGNKLGFKFRDDVTLNEIFDYSYGTFILEVNKDVPYGSVLGTILEDRIISYRDESLNLEDILDIYDNKLESVYPTNTNDSDNYNDNECLMNFDYKCKANVKSGYNIAKPKFLIPVFPGTNCEYDSSRAVVDAGGYSEIFVVKNLSYDDIENSISDFSKKIRESQVIFIPGGFSGGDEPDGAAKFIMTFFRNPMIREEIDNFLNKKDGLILGICNGFQALLKLGLVPYGKIIDTNKSSPTLTFNRILRHQSKIVRTRVCSNKSPWLRYTNVGEVYSVPISHGEGRFIVNNDELLNNMRNNGQITTQYVDFDNKPTMDIKFNPNGSDYAIEGITSPDGRIFGKMGHIERVGDGLYKNVSGNYDMKIFKSAIEYFK